LASGGRGARAGNPASAALLAARELPARLAAGEGILLAQLGGEILRVLTCHSRRSEQQARDAGGVAWQMLLATNVVSVLWAREMPAPLGELGRRVLHQR